jgi:hypothetical protein
MNNIYNMTIIYIMQNAGNTPTKQLSLYDSLRVGYLPSEKQQGQEMSKYGFQIDKGLSNDNQQVYFNPTTNKLLYNVTGSQSLNDWVNVDAKLALGGTIGKGIKAIGKPLERGIETLLPSSWKSKFERGYENIVGGFKDTDRYKQADETLKAAKAKYNPADVSITGHSLGGRIVQDIAKKSDKVFALDPGQTIGQKVKGNQNVYRSAGDIVSLASAGSKNITTLPNPHTRKIIPALISGNAATIGIATAIDAFHAHDIGNIKGSNIFV